MITIIDNKDNNSHSANNFIFWYDTWLHIILYIVSLFSAGVTILYISWKYYLSGEELGIIEQQGMAMLEKHISPGGLWYRPGMQPTGSWMKL